LYLLIGICCSSCIVFGISGLKINKYSLGGSFVGKEMSKGLGAIYDLIIYDLPFLIYQF
jgi:hypothetical protein